jgi:hypothetical protein
MTDQAQTSHNLRNAWDGRHPTRICFSIFDIGRMLSTVKDIVNLLHGANLETYLGYSFS